MLLTDYQAFVIFKSISEWDTKNKAKEKPYLDLDFFKKLLKIKQALQPTVEAVSEVNISMVDLYKRKDVSEYNIEPMKEPDLNQAGMLDSVEALEIFGWIIKP